PIVVGYDGSASAVTALAFAAREAALLGAPLRIVHAYVWPVLYAPLANIPLRPDDWRPPASVRSVVETAVRRGRAHHPGLTVESTIVAGPGGSVLVEESRGAAMLVTGHRGLGGVAGLLAGSVAAHVVAHAQCPILVVGRSGAIEHGRICAGVTAQN